MNSFDSQFQALSGNKPFPWQRRLFEKFLNNDFPKFASEDDPKNPGGDRKVKYISKIQRLGPSQKEKSLWMDTKNTRIKGPLEKSKMSTPNSLKSKGIFRLRLVAVVTPQKRGLH
jgi:hypothetical protein